jgi:hypothetical protein
VQDQSHESIVPGGASSKFSGFVPSGEHSLPSASTTSGGLSFLGIDWIDKLVLNLGATD